MLRGGCQRRDVALGLWLGLMAGLAGGCNLTVAVLVAVAALLNVSTISWLSASVVGGLLCWQASTWTRALGMLLLDEFPLGTAVAALGDGPIVALFGFDEYRVVGGLAIGLVLSVPAAKAVYIFRPRCPDEVATSGRWLRRGFWLATPAMLALTCMVTWHRATQNATTHLLNELSRLNGRPVTTGRLTLSLWTGRLEIHDLHVPIDGDFEDESLCIGKVSAELHTGQLVRGRFHADRVSLEDITAPSIGSPSMPRDLPRVVAIEADPASPDRANESLVEMQKYVAGWTRLGERTEWLRRVIVACESVMQVDAPRLKLDALSDGLPTQRSALGSAEAKIVIDTLEVERLTPAWGLGPKAKLSITQLASNAASVDRHARCRVILPEQSAEIVAELDNQPTDRRHRIRFTAYELPIERLIDVRCTTLNARGGHVSLTGEGWVTSNEFVVQVHCEARDLDASLEGNTTLAGLSPTLWTRGLASLSAVHVDGTLVGPWKSPRLQVPMTDLVSQFRHQLRSAGEHELAAMIDAERDGSLRQAIATEHDPFTEVASTIAQPQSTESKPIAPRIEPLPPVDVAPRVVQAPAPPISPQAMPAPQETHSKVPRVAATLPATRSRDPYVTRAGTSPLYAAMPVKPASVEVSPASPPPSEVYYSPSYPTSGSLFGAPPVVTDERPRVPATPPVAPQAKIEHRKHEAAPASEDIRPAGESIDKPSIWNRFATTFKIESQPEVLSPEDKKAIEAAAVASSKANSNAGISDDPTVKTSIWTRLVSGVKVEPQPEVLSAEDRKAIEAASIAALRAEGKSGASEEPTVKPSIWARFATGFKADPQPEVLSPEDRKAIESVPAMREETTLPTQRAKAPSIRWPWSPKADSAP
jgi:hypothetical protein